MNYGIGGYRLTRLYDPDFDQVRREKRVGVLGLVSYPFNQFTRVEGSMQVRHATNHLMQDGTVATVDLVSNFVSLVHDGSRWWWDGPMGGTRLNLTAGFTRDITTGRADYGTLLGEVRHHRRPFRGLVLASRLHGIMSYGNDAQRAYLGGPMRLRVDDRRVISGLRMVNAQVEGPVPAAARRRAGGPRRMDAAHAARSGVRRRGMGVGPGQPTARGRCRLRGLPGRRILPAVPLELGVALGRLPHAHVADARDLLHDRLLVLR